MTALQRLAAVHKQNEVSWDREVSHKAHRTPQASTSKQVHHKSVTLISTGDTSSLHKLQYIDPVKYCVQNYSVYKTGKEAGCCPLPYWSETPLCYSFILQYHTCTGTYDIHLLQCIINSQFCTLSIIIFMACLCHNNINIKIQ